MNPDGHTRTVTSGSHVTPRETLIVRIVNCCFLSPFFLPLASSLAILRAVIPIALCKHVQEGPRSNYCFFPLRFFYVIIIDDLPSHESQHGRRFLVASRTSTEI